MCGIVGAVADRNVSPILLEGLQRLEYRGYDSAGIAVMPPGEAHMAVRKRAGKVRDLAADLRGEPVAGRVGIAHTRWATHGAPSDRNAHPHLSNGRICLVHNGIVENFESLRAELEAAGYSFDSDTDSEVVAHLVDYHYSREKNLLEAVRCAVRRLEGAYAIGVIARDDPGRIVATRVGSPLVVGVGIGENYIASDVLALKPRDRPLHHPRGRRPGGHHPGRDFHLESRGRIRRTLDGQGGNGSRRCRQGQLPPPHAEGDLRAAPRAGQHPGGKDRQAAGARARIRRECRRRFRPHPGGHHHRRGHQLLRGQYRPVLDRGACGHSLLGGDRQRIPLPPSPSSRPDSLFVSISQSGETADTLAALRAAGPLGYFATLTLCNVATSSCVRESDLALMIQAGPEIGVASTKAFTAQLTALALLLALLGRRHGLDEAKESRLVAGLRDLPACVEQALALDGRIGELAERFADRHHALFLGRGIMYPVALEGALKLKEISYIHAEGYPAGELKHGPLALVDEDMPVVAVAPNDELLEKLQSNLQEVRARGGELFVFADRNTGFRDGPGITVIPLPEVDPLLAPIVYTVPLQLLAYHVAVLKGTDVDQPRNLAKSVTVE